MYELFRLLTGAPASVYELTKDFRSFLIIIDTALKRNHVVTLEGIKEEYVEQCEKMYGLMPYQAYRVMSIKKTGIKLRNINCGLYHSNNG